LKFLGSNPNFIPEVEDLLTICDRLYFNLIISSNGLEKLKSQPLLEEIKGILGGDVPVHL